MGSLGSLLSRLRPHPATLRFYLIKLILVALAPVLIFSVGMIILFARQERAALERGLQETTRALTLAVDREVESSVTTLEALTTSEHEEFLQRQADLLDLTDEAILACEPGGAIVYWKLN